MERTFPDLTPVCAECSTSAFGITLDHRFAGVLVGVFVDLVEKLLQCGISSSILRSALCSKGTGLFLNERSEI